MKKTALIGLTLTLALALVASTALAGPWGGRFYGMGPMLQNLTPEQSSEILKLQQAHQEKVAPIQQQLFTKKMELRTLMFSQNPDQAKVAALQKEVFELIDEIQQESSNLRMEMLKVITPQEKK
ncbi:MAG: periplasmic heavy metal sensor [Desulfobacterales bacterium]|nr:periplasmic heavy metal sensor [Desulfobacterales bacterium]